MSYSLTKLKSKSSGRELYDLINDSCDTHNLFDKDLNRVSSFRFDEWFDVENLYEEVEFESQNEYDLVWNKIKKNI